ncbi:MAG TPA: hypothetical protein VGJ76_04380 [Pseudolabrys sp.]|jgi:hypothetical protein
MGRNAQPVPSSQVRQEALRQADRRLALLCLACTLRSAIEQAALDIDVTAPDGRVKRGTADGAVTCSGVKPNQSEARDVLANVALRVLDAHHLLCPPCGADKLRGLRAGQPLLTRRRFFRQHHRDDL